MSKKVPKTKNDDLLVQLRDSIKKRNKKQAKQLLLKNTIVENSKCKSAHTLIHWAILKFLDVEILKMLIDQGANVYTKNYHRQTPLNLAIQQQHVKATKLLLDKKAYVGEDFKSLLEIAVNTESEKLVKLLIDCGVKNKLFNNLNNLLNLAVTKGLPKIVKMVIPHCKFRKAKKQISEVTVLIGGQKFNECLNILLQYGFKMESGCEENDTFVFDSVKHGYLAILKELLSLGLNVNTTSETTGLTLLQTACLYKQHKVAELLLKHKADVNCIVRRGSIMWHRDFFAEKLKLLLGKTAPYIVVENADSKMLDILLNHGANIPYEPEFISLMSRIIRHNHLEILQVFIKHGFNVNAKMANGRTLLHDCARCKIQLIQFFKSQSSRSEHSLQLQIAELLLKNGANVDAQGLDGETPLFIALKSNFSQMVDFLLKNKANVHHKNIDGNTPFHAIAQESWISTIIVRSLLKCKVNINEPNILGITPFHFACSKWNSKLIKILIEHGADINLIDNNGRKALHFAATGQDFKVAQLLLKKGACTNDRDYSDRTPLHILCNQLADPSVDILKLFLQHGAEINSLDCHKKTPLFYACKKGNLKTVKMLLTHHAKVNHVDMFGMTPVYVAAECSAKVAKFLMSRKTTITNFVTQEGKTLLHALVEEKRSDLIEQYINTLNIHIDTVDNFGKTPLHYAAAAAQENIVLILLQHGADINIANNQKPTIPMYIYARMVKINQELTKVLNSLRQNFNEFDNYIRLRKQYFPSWKKLRYYKRIMYILRQHLIKLKAAHLTIHPQNIRFSIYDNTNTDLYTDEIDTANLEGYKLLCEIEVKMLQTTKIPETDFCLCDILIKDTRILASHFSLEAINSFLKQDYLSISFPIYIDLIKYRLSKALRRKKFLNIAHSYSASSIFFGLPVVFTNQIFSYIDNNEIKNFNQAVGVVKFLNQSEQDNLKVLLKTNATKFLRELKTTETDNLTEPTIKVTKKLKRY